MQLACWVCSSDTCSEAEVAAAVASAADNVLSALDRGPVSPSAARVPRVIEVPKQVSVGVVARRVAGEPPEVITATKFEQTQKFQTARSKGIKIANGLVTLPDMDISHLNSSQWVNRTQSRRFQDISSQTIIWSDDFNPFVFGGVKPADEGAGETVALRSQIVSSACSPVGKRSFSKTFLSQSN